jgi:hypothetical protein
MAFKDTFIPAVRMLAVSFSFEQRTFGGFIHVGSAVLYGQLLI